MTCLSLLSCFTAKSSRSRGKSSVSDSMQEGDPAISAPWGFKHHTHIDEAFQGVPPELEDEFRRALIAKGLSIPEKNPAATTSFVYSGQ